MSDSDCIFCRIVNGELPCTKVYEDDRTLAFMDIAPVVKGHTLVIPKSHSDSLRDTPETVLAEIIPVVGKVARAQYEGLGADGVNVTQANGSVAGQVVPHIHFHVIPRFEGDGHRWNWRQLEYDNPDEMSELANRIAGALHA
jgi:histidine triad (HIT) family protein